LFSLNAGATEISFAIFLPVVVRKWFANKHHKLCHTIIVCSFILSAYCSMISSSCSFNTGVLVFFGMGVYTVIHCDSSTAFNRGNQLLVPFHPNPSRSKTLFMEE
jgi:membrane-bound metal-dependent hydrolase YbcI (DUF457 family)